MTWTGLDLIDNFFGTDADLRHVTGRRIDEFGVEARRYEAAWEMPEPKAGSVYVGGLPSANLWLPVGDLVMTSLLFSSGAVGRDPILDWFSDRRYGGSPGFVSRPGYRGAQSDDRCRTVRETRKFLITAVEGMRSIRPLLDRGLVTLVPSRRLLNEERHAVRQLSTDVHRALVADLDAIVSDFDPSEIPVDDNHVGLFVFAGGNAAKQAARELARATNFFAGEVALSQLTGSTYVAPFPFEQRLLDTLAPGVDDSQRELVQNLLLTNLPIFRGLTAKVVAEIHNEDSIADFRQELVAAYAAPNLTRVVEAPVLAAKSEAARRALTRSRFRALGVALGDGAIAAATAYIGGAGPAASVGSGAAVSGTAGVRELRSDQAGSLSPVWMKLARHERSRSLEVPRLVRRASNATTAQHPWGIAPEPSMNVVVTAGSAIIDWFGPGSDGDGSEANPYGTCPCGSTEKYKHCCRV